MYWAFNKQWINPWDSFILSHGFFYRLNSFKLGGQYEKRQL